MENYRNLSSGIGPEEAGTEDHAGINRDCPFVFSLDAVHDALTREKNMQGFCEYPVFSLLYAQLMEQKENPPMYFGIFTASGPGPAGRRAAMAGMNAILTENLCGADLATLFSENITAALLSCQRDRNGMKAAERISRVRDLFYASFPREQYGFYARIRQIMPDGRRFKGIEVIYR